LRCRPCSGHAVATFRDASRGGQITLRDEGHHDR
jgi:hypothetical protein